MTNSLNYAAASTWPKVIVVGDPNFGDALAGLQAQWVIQPVVTTVSGMWDAIEMGQLDADSLIVVIADGTASVPDELEATLAAYAPFAHTFLMADPVRGEQMVARAQALAPTVPNGDPSKPIWVLPADNMQQAIDMMRRVIGDQVAWEQPAPPQTHPPAPKLTLPSQYVTPAPGEMIPPMPPEQQPAPEMAAPTRSPEHMAPPVQPLPAATVAAQPVEPQPAPQPAPSADVKSYEQAQVYSDDVLEQANAWAVKPPNARPGQMTISSMSSKGGSGKSTSALLLAATIAKASAAAGEPKKVVLVDLDTRDGQVASLIGQYMPTSINIRVMPTWDADTVTANLVHDKRLGIDALLAPVRPRNADDVGPDFYRHIIGVLQTTHDVVILDCSVNYLDPLLGVAFAMSDEILFVTTLATTSVQGMARSLTELFADPADGGLGIPREKVGIVANQVLNNVGMGKDKLLRAAIGAPLVGQIPSDQDAVLVATNSNRMHDLLKHPRIGPAVFKLAVNCLPGHNLAPITTEQATATATPADEKSAPKKGLFRR